MEYDQNLNEMLDLTTIFAPFFITLSKDFKLDTPQTEPVCY